MIRPSLALDRVRLHVRLLMSAQHVKQAALAKHLGVSSGWISMFLQGKRPIAWPLIDKIAEFFQVPLSALFADLRAGAEDPDPLPVSSFRERKGPNATAAPRVHHRSKVAHAPAVLAQQANIKDYLAALTRDQATRTQLQQTLDLAENHLSVLLDHVRSVNQGTAAHDDHVRPRTAASGSVRPPRAGRR